MKKLLLIGTTMLLMATSASASPVYDRNGNLIGNNVANSDGSATLYDRNGNLLLHAVSRGKNLIVTYDRNGRVVGTGRVHGSSMTHYDRNGRVIGGSTGLYKEGGTGCSRGHCWRFSTGAFHNQ